MQKNINRRVWIAISNITIYKMKKRSKQIEE